jgi:hypothetical protein
MTTKTNGTEKSNSKKQKDYEKKVEFMKTLPRPGGKRQRKKR